MDLPQWIKNLANDIAGRLSLGGLSENYAGTGACSIISRDSIADLIMQHVPPASESPLLQCIDCKNTESPAGAMARAFNHGRCMHCGGYFKVVRA